MDTMPERVKVKSNKWSVFKNQNKINKIKQYKINGKLHTTSNFF